MKHLKNKKTNLLKQYSAIITIERLVFIIFIECSIIIFFKTQISIAVLSNLRNVLITSTSVFSAIVIGLLTQGINSHAIKIQKHKDKLEKLSFRLTTFRRLLHYLVESGSIWGTDFYKDFLRKLIKLYPKVNINVSKSGMEKNNNLYSIVSSEKYNYRTTRLFMSFLTIADINEREHIKLVSPSSKFEYSYDKLIYMNESFNNIWYYLSNKKAEVNISEATFNDVYIDDFSKQLKILFENRITMSDLNEQLIVDLGNEFYHENIPKMFEHLNVISKGVPKLFKFLSIELMLILFLGLFLPMFSFLIQEVYLPMLMQLSVVFLTFIFGLIVYQLSKFIFFDSNNNYF